MTNKFFIFFSDLEFERANLVSISEKEEVTDITENALPLLEATAKIRQHQVIVVLPSYAVTVHNVEFPSISRQEIEQSLKYLLEERIIDDLEDNYFTLGSQIEKNTYLVNVIAKNILNDLMNKLSAVDIAPDIICTEYDFLRLDNCIGSIIYYDDLQKYILINHNNNYYGCLDRENFSSIIQDLQKKLTANDTKISINYYYTHENAEVLNLLQELNNAEIVDKQITNKFQWFTDNFNNQQTTNLLPHKYIAHKSYEAAMIYWKYIAAVFLVGVLFIFIGKYLHYYELNSYANHLGYKVKTEYKKIMPQSNFVPNNVYAVVNKEIKSMEENLVTSQYLPLLSAFSTGIHGYTKIRIRQLNYFEKKLSVVLQADNFGQLSSVIKSISESPHIKVQRKAANLVHKKVIARLEIKHEK